MGADRGTPTVDLVFPVRGPEVPVDHGYLLFSALASRVPGLHERRDVGVFTLRGQFIAGDLLRLAPGALRIRCSAEAIPLFLGLTGLGLSVAGRSLTVGAPTVCTLVPVPELSSRLVTFKHALEEQSFLEAASLRLQQQGLGGRRHMGCGLFLPTPESRAQDSLRKRATG